MTLDREAKSWLVGLHKEACFGHSVDGPTVSRLAALSHTLFSRSPAILALREIPTDDEGNQLRGADIADIMAHNQRVSAVANEYDALCRVLESVVALDKGFVAELLFFGNTKHSITRLSLLVPFVGFMVCDHQYVRASIARVLTSCLKSANLRSRIALCLADNLAILREDNSATHECAKDMLEMMLRTLFEKGKPVADTQLILHVVNTCVRPTFGMKDFKTCWLPCVQIVVLAYRNNITNVLDTSRILARNWHSPWDTALVALKAQSASYLFSYITDKEDQIAALGEIIPRVEKCLSDSNSVVVEAGLAFLRIPRVRQLVAGRRDLAKRLVEKMQTLAEKSASVAHKLNLYRTIEHLRE